MAITDSIKDILSVKIKPRHDTYSDQFSRIFMVKVLMIAALLVGLNWYNDKINCIIPDAVGADGKFVSSACWINGFYVYEQIRYHANEVGYFGMPRDINHDGMFPNGDVCSTFDTTRNRAVPECKPMEKTFFLQYQYMTFIMAALALVYYAPYAFFRLVNQDFVSLKNSIKGDNIDEGVIVENYFNHKVNSVSKMRGRICSNICIKILYIVVNVGCFLFLDSILNGGFVSYGFAWTSWSKLDNAMAYDYMGQRHSPKPGNALLPTFGFCEVHESSKDIKTTVINKYKFVCEISQHILYHYVFILVWFAMVFGIVISIIGLIAKLVDHVITITCFLKGGSPARRMYERLTLRECEYLEFIRRKDKPLYNRVIQKLKEVYNDVLVEPTNYNKAKY